MDGEHVQNSSVLSEGDVMDDEHLLPDHHSFASGLQGIM